jgi:hypothetical protein
MTLTEQNYREMRRGIPIHNLSPLFQQAIYITYELKFSYIWIDSLCIIQNSPDFADWLQESSTMHSVYQNSTCNLSATGFAHGQEGLIPNENVTAICRPEVDFSKLLRVPSPCTYTILHRDWVDDIQHAPLLKRAWVYQEQIMVSTAERSLNAMHC